MKHSTYSASSSNRWTRCPGSIAACRGIPGRSGHAARRGTAGHDLAERCLKQDLDPFNYIGETIQVEDAQIPMDEELVDAVAYYVEYVRGFSGIRLVEVKSDYSGVLGVEVGDGFGTADCVILDGTTLHVIDLKLGHNYVDPQKNRQLLLYAIGLVDTLETVLGETVEEVYLHIVQPFLSRKPKPYHIERSKLPEQMYRRAVETAEEARKSFTDLSDELWTKQYLTPGEIQCEWCPIRGPTCPEHRAFVKEHTPTDEDAVMTEGLSDDVLAEEYEALPLLKIYSDAVEAETMRRLTVGRKINGFKLVLGRQGNRKWEDEEKAEETFKDLDPTVTHDPPKLKSPAKMEKVLKKDPRKDKIEELVTRAPAKPTIAPADDPRPTWSQVATADEFEPVTE